MLCSLADVRSGMGGFKIYEMGDAVGLAAEWSHSLNMLDLDVSSIYHEVCDMMTNDSGTIQHRVDVVVSCDQTRIFIGFLAGLRNRTGLKCVESISSFFGMEGHALSDVVILSSVWEDMPYSGMRTILHLDKNTTSFCFELNGVQESESNDMFGFAKNVSVLITFIAAIALCLLYAENIWSVL